MEFKPHYRLVADPVKMKARRAEWGEAPKHFVHEGAEVVRILPGQILPGEEFDWYGDPDNPPRWCSPLCDKGRAAYEVRDRRDELKRTQAKRIAANRMKSELAQIEAELQAEREAAGITTKGLATTSKAPEAAGTGKGGSK